MTLPILGPPSGTPAQAIAWLDSRADESYRGRGVRDIVESYQRWGDGVGLDWFMAIAQMCHETGNLTSFWSLRPQRNPAGIGVTGRFTTQWPADVNERTWAGLRWSYNYQRTRWEDGLRFLTWADHAIPAHLGRLLAYALVDDQVADAPGDPDPLMTLKAWRRTLIATALSVRPLPPQLRGVATTWTDLNRRWAVPGREYGEVIAQMAERIRRG